MCTINHSTANSSPKYYNTLRRLLISKIPTLGFYSCEIENNFSTLHDEILVQRICTLIIIPTNLNILKSNRDTIFTAHLNVNYDKNKQYVTSKDIIFDDANMQIDNEIVLCKMSDNLKIDMTLYIKISNGSEHALWSHFIVSHDVENNGITIEGPNVPYLNYALQSALELYVGA